MNNGKKNIGGGFDFALSGMHEKIVSDSVTSFIRKIGRPFTFGEACEELLPGLRQLQIENAAELLEDMLLNHHWIADVKDKGDDMIFTPMSTIFNGGSFCVTPFQERINDGTFFPGHLFHPFISMDVINTDAVIIPEDSCMQIPKKIAELPFLEVGTACYTDRDSYDLIINRADFVKTDGAAQFPGINEKILKVEAYDMKEYYKEVSFALGDTILFTVEDFHAGKIRFRRIPQNGRLNDGEKLDFGWLKDFLSAMFETVENEGPESNIFRQLTSLYMGNPSLLKSPNFSLIEALGVSWKLRLAHNRYGEPIIWDKDRPMPKKGKKK